ncbi:hypothetical protein [Azospirillum sp. B510]|uniref:hypothetical protein n=1 Tax=Alphaproteobacteria TaxID=28211 RepID=UPI0013052AB4|nr:MULTISPECIES: hypothetical protein [Alphaproteobacteria]
MLFIALHCPVPLFRFPVRIVVGREWSANTLFFHGLVVSGGQVRMGGRLFPFLAIKLL